MRKRKITKRQALRRRRILKLTLFTIIVFLLYLLIFKNPLFNLKKISVKGNTKTKTEVIKSNSTFREGYNIFKINKKEGINKIKKLPYIKEVDIKLKLPNEIEIKVSERDSVAFTKYLDSYAYIDRDSRVLYIGNKLYKQKKPEIFGLKLSNIKEGKNIFTKENKDELNLLRLLDDKNWEDKIKYINLYDSDNLVLELVNGEKIYFGNFSNLEYKLDFLEEILADAKSKKIKIKSVDFNKGENPIVVPEQLGEIDSEDE